MRRWGDGQGTHLTGAEHGEICRRIEAGETFVKVAAAIGCSTKSIQRLLDVRPRATRKTRVRSARRLSLAEREELSRGLVLGHSFRRVAQTLGRATSTVSREVNANGRRLPSCPGRGDCGTKEPSPEGKTAQPVPAASTRGRATTPVALVAAADCSSAVRRLPIGYHHARVA